MLDYEQERYTLFLNNQTGCISLVVLISPDAFNEMGIVDQLVIFNENVL